MAIDWFTFAAQLLNFIVLAWLLKRFLYKPILDAIAAREQRISTQLKDAATVAAEAQQQLDEFQHKNSEFDQQRAALLEQASNEAKAENARLVEEARKTIDATSRKRLQALDSSVENATRAAGHRVQQEVFAIARKILRELAAESLEERIATTFIARLQALDTDTRKRLQAAMHSDMQDDPQGLLVRSAFALSKPQRNAIESALDEISTAGMALRFETVPDLVSGVEVIANGHKIAWSISAYLDSLERSVHEVMAEKDKTKQPSARDPVPEQESR